MLMTGFEPVSPGFGNHRSATTTTTSCLYEASKWARYLKAVSFISFGILWMVKSRAIVFWWPAFVPPQPPPVDQILNRCRRQLADIKSFGQQKRCNNRVSGQPCKSPLLGNPLARFSRLNIESNVIERKCLKKKLDGTQTRISGVRNKCYTY